MKYAIVALMAAALVVPGAAQVEGPSETGEEVEIPEENQSDDEVNQSGQEKGASAQFDARLGTAIQTLDTLVNIAPTDEARSNLEEARGILVDVQNSTETASLGEGDSPGDEAENQEDQRGPSEEAGPPEQAGPPEDTGERGPSESSNRPGFVTEMLNGIFG